MKTFRNNGAIGAILDEYERSIEELIDLINIIPENALTVIVDKDTQDLDCQSIQSILTHVVRAGYSYMIYIRNWQGESLDFPEKKLLDSFKKYEEALQQMFEANEQLFRDYPNLPLEEYNQSKKILTNWGQIYDVEQLLEHAIVHILRHRRQIERFLLKL